MIYAVSYVQDTQEDTQQLEVRQWTWYCLPFCARLPSRFNLMTTWVFCYFVMLLQLKKLFSIQWDGWMTINAKKRSWGNSHDKDPIPITHLEKLKKTSNSTDLLQIPTNTTTECYCNTIMFDDSVFIYWFSDCNQVFIYFSDLHGSLTIACLLFCSRKPQAQWFHQTKNNADIYTHARSEGCYTGCSLWELQGTVHLPDLTTSHSWKKVMDCGGIPIKCTLTIVKCWK
jgi:hypothetical protein